MWKLMVDLFEDLWLVALAADLLYLFYTSAWYDPNPVIESIEVVTLWCFCLFGSYRAIDHVWDALKRDKGGEV